MTWYNESFLNTTNPPLALVQGISDNAGGWFGGAILVFLWLLMLVWFNKNNNQDAFLASSFITSIIAGMFFGIGIVSPWVLSIPVSMTVVSVIMKVWGEG